MKIICVGYNYHGHSEVLPDGGAGNPVFFIKPDTALLRGNQPLYYPRFTQDLRCGVALALRICRMGRSISERFAHRYYAQVGVGVDFTAHDVQQECIKKGLPWEACKAFDYSAPVSPSFVELAALRDAADIKFSLELNGKTVQQAGSSEMIFGFSRIVSHVSSYVTLRMGDLIFTGTPPGDGSVKIGDTLVAKIEGTPLLSVEIK
ncbi:MAG: fumarylacetoacetate hydrolase family protein [Prevotellaceae bacterium]|jgi:2-keto-4-pentenoate hydratase/2-oxohepta-3-ene-1,7-dioic acid hydratase in catechol pathway|nr:fumarylacetoacetate hydrolase family protein [Prevotellaceae bacterium]